MVGVKKPNPKIFNHALQMAKATKEESLMIGDNLEADIMGAKNAGFDSNKIMGYSLRNDNYRFTIWMNNFTSKQPFNESQIYASEMYDYVKDPLEKVNVVNDKNYTSISASLKSKMVAFFKSQETKQ